MSDSPVNTPGLRLTSRSGLSLRLDDNGSIQRFECGGISLSLFVGNEVEGGPANLYLRRLAHPLQWTPLLGPFSSTRFHASRAGDRLLGVGSWLGINYSLALVLAQDAAAWFWHIELENTTSTPQEVDLTYAQDVALAPYGAVRLNEFYVSQYIDHTPLSHPARGVMIASRQNQAVEGLHPWTLIGSLRNGISFATDALQFHGLRTRSERVPLAITSDLPGRRLQHEHSLVVIRDAPLQLAPNARIATGFFGSYVADHPDATSAADLNRLTGVLALSEAAPPREASAAGPGPAQEPSTPGPTSAREVSATGQASAEEPSRSAPAPQHEGSPAAVPATAATLFSAAPLLNALDLDAGTVSELFASSRRHEELDESGELLSFFHGEYHHVVLRAKELRVQRPHGHLLRTGRHTTPDESALTSTAWMSGVFHSMLTQGHVSINRFLSTVHSYLSLFRSHGQRVFVETGNHWRLLDVPSAFEIAPDSCRWVYRHERGTIQVRAEARSAPHELTLSIDVSSGEPVRFLISHHVALNGDDGSAAGPALWRREHDTIIVSAAASGDVGQRFPDGSFHIAAAGTQIDRVGGDELLFADGRSRQQPFVCILTAPTSSVRLSIRGHLVPEESQHPLRVEPGSRLVPALSARAPDGSALSEPLARLADIVPWFTHNALVHYLSPRGLEQYSGGGWGTRDVCQGPVEMLLALGRIEPIRDLLLRVMRAQNADGDWPQWFMFFERERHIRPGDSHGDIVFWPLLVLAQYLTASGDAGVLDERVPYFDPRGPEAGEQETVWQHAQRALAVIEKRVIPGTALAAYGHGDWNDSLQPADPMMRERLCSAWTVTLHFQTLTALAQALHKIGRAAEAARLERWAESVKRDFQRLLLADGVLTGYALFAQDANPRYLLHPSDNTTGVHYSALAMIHAVLEDLLTPSQAREHLRLIDEHLMGPDGVRLFDRPMAYHGGLQRLFQRAESATFFGREIGLMYMHAHLRYAQALAHVGDAAGFFRALCQANPIGIRSIVPSAAARQANCYYSSSDAAFEDRAQASAEYDRVARGAIRLDGGWRVYSSGAGIALGMIMRRFLGLTREAEMLSVDPVIPSALDGLTVRTILLERPVDVRYRIGSAGCGVRALALNGQSLSFMRGANPHRPGAALVPMPAVAERLSSDRNHLEIEMA